MNGRMQLLLGIVALVIVYFAGSRVVDMVMSPLAESRRNTATLRKNIGIQEDNLDFSRTKTRYIPAWEARSLPPNKKVARSLYQAWLLELVEHVDFESPSVNSAQPVGRTHFNVFTFTVRGRGTLRQLTKFLFEFYQAPHLHKINSVGISPIAKSDHLDLSFSIEALALKNAIDTDGKDRHGELSTVTREWLAANNLIDPADLGDAAILEDYEVIAERNLFDVGGTLDATEHTYFDAVVSVDGEDEAWFTLRSVGVGGPERVMVRRAESDTWITLSSPDESEPPAGAMPQKLKLRTGDSFRINSFRATVVALEESDIILDSGGSRWLLTIGEKVTDAIALPPEF